MYKDLCIKAFNSVSRGKITMVRVSRRCRRQMLCLVILALLMCILVPVLNAGQHPTEFRDRSSVELLSAIYIISIGCENELCSGVINAMRERNASVMSFLDIPQPETLKLPDPKSTVTIFDGLWVKRKVSDEGFHEFLADLSSAGILLVTIGGDTSSFYDALKEAGVHHFAPGRNPVYFDPPVVGYKKIGDAEGVLVCNSDDISDIIQAILFWISIDRPGTHPMASTLSFYPYPIKFSQKK